VQSEGRPIHFPLQGSEAGQSQGFGNRQGPNVVMIAADYQAVVSAQLGKGTVTVNAEVFRNQTVRPSKPQW